MTYDTILKLSHKYSYFSYVYTNMDKYISHIKLGHSGLIFQNNIKSQWLFSNIKENLKNICIFNYKNKSQNNSYEPFFKMKNLCNNQLPLGTIEIYKEHIETNPELHSKNDDFFSCHSFTSLLSSVFIPPGDAVQFFFNWQSQRRLWWKKMSAFPNRIFLGESVCDANDTTIEIFAQYPWGKLTLEKLKMSYMNSNQDYKLYHKGKLIYPVKISNEINLNTATVALFCDSFDSSTGNIILRVNRVLAPYKCIFAFCNEGEERKKIIYLAIHIFQELKRNKIASVLNDCTLKLEDQLKRNDEWGIPYTILLEKQSLETGIVKVRCRDTTLMEDVHVTDLITYMPCIFKQFPNFKIRKYDI